MMRSCPEILAELDGKAEAVSAYIDEATSTANSLTTMIYRQPNGTVFVAWQTSDISEGEMEGWAHSLDIYVRALRQKSPLPLINAIIDGVPAGEAVRWRYSCVNDFVMPMQVEEIARLTDEEGIDFYVIRTSFKEKGDSSYGVSR